MSATVFGAAPGWWECLWVAAFGMRSWGSDERHDFVLGTISAGWIVTEVKARDSWRRGNLELRGELFGGEQLEPARYAVGLTPALRYHFATGTRFVPFVQGGRRRECHGHQAPGPQHHF